MSAKKRSYATAVATEDFFLFRMGRAVPKHVTHVRIHSSVERIPENTFQYRTDLVEVELHDGLRSIGFGAFHRCSSLLRIMIPSSVTDIGINAFESCRSLTTVTLTEGLRAIGDCAFQNCPSLHLIKIPSSVTTIEDSAFRKCTYLTEVNLAEGLRTIGDFAFQECPSLHRIRIPSSVTDIGNRAFVECMSLTEVNLEEGLQAIGVCAFRECPSLHRIMIPSSVTAIGDGAFLDCMSLTEVNLEEGLQTIGDQAFQGCSSLHRIMIPSSVTAIGNGAFSSCTSLKEVNLEEGLQTIGDQTFRECTSLLSINIPSTVNSLDLNTFGRCTLLRNVVIAPSSALTQNVFELSLRFLQNMGFSLEMIKGRFDELPLHRHCYYYHPQHNVEQTIDGTTREWFNEEVDRLPAHGLRQDCLGMTPLHVLLCSSTEYDVRVCQCMIEKYPRAMLIKDKWGEVPLAYALLGGAPMEVIHFLLDTHMQRWRAMPFDFGIMILRLAKKRLPSAGYFRDVIRAQRTHADYVRDVIRAQRTYHHALEIDWQQIVGESIRARCNIPLRVFRILVEASVSKRSICMSDEHRIEVDASLDEIEIEIGNDDEVIVRYYEEIRDMVTSYVRLHHGQLKESMTILELAIWKAMVCSKIVDQESRNECRTTGGRCLEVVIKHVLAFL